MTPVSTYTPQSAKVLVAVYGSLRLGMSNESVNAQAKAEYLYTAQTKDNYDLFEYGGSYFPSVSLEHNESGTPVTVDVFLTTKAGLEGPYDSLEGYDPDPEVTFYNRTEIPIMLPTGDIVMAWIYHIDEISGRRVEHGDWVRHKKEIGDY